MKTNQSPTEKAPKFHAFKRTEDGGVFVQWKKGGKFRKVDPEIAAFIVFYVLEK